MKFFTSAVVIAALFAMKCAHPKCDENHRLTECKLMKAEGLSGDAYRQQFKKYLDAYFEKIKSSKGSGFAVTEKAQSYQTIQPKQPSNTTATEPESTPLARHPFLIVFCGTQYASRRRSATCTDA